MVIPVMKPIVPVELSKVLMRLGFEKFHPPVVPGAGSPLSARDVNEPDETLNSPLSSCPLDTASPWRVAANETEDPSPPSACVNVKNVAPFTGAESPVMTSFVFTVCADALLHSAASSPAPTNLVTRRVDFVK